MDIEERNIMDYTLSLAFNVTLWLLLYTQFGV